MLEKKSICVDPGHKYNKLEYGKIYTVVYDGYYYAKVNKNGLFTVYTDAKFKEMTPYDYRELKLKRILYI